MAHSTIPGVVQHPLQQSLDTHRFISRGYHKISMNFTYNLDIRFFPSYAPDIAHELITGDPTFNTETSHTSTSTAAIMATGLLPDMSVQSLWRVNVPIDISLVHRSLPLFQCCHQKGWISYAMSQWQYVTCRWCQSDLHGSVTMAIDLDFQPKLWRAITCSFHTHL